MHVWRYAVDHLAFHQGKTIAYHAFSEVRNNFSKLEAAPEKQLDKVDDTGMELLLRSNDLVVASENNVLNAVVCRLNSASPGAQYKERAAWLSLIRWGRLSQDQLGRAWKHLESDAAKADVSQVWAAAYTRGLQDALGMLVSNGEARLRDGNIPRGGLGRHVIVVAAKVEAGSGVHVSSFMVVGADLWQLSVDSGGGDDKGKAAGGDYLPVTLTRLPAADVAEAAGVAAPAAVHVKADLFTFALPHRAHVPAPFDSCQAQCDAWSTENGYSRMLASQSAVLRRGESPTPNEVATKSVSTVEFRQAVTRSNADQVYYHTTKRAATFEGRLGVGVAFSLTAVVGEDASRVA